jgi:hypothetical protein
VIGLPSFIVGSIALGLVLVGMVAASAEGASLPIILGHGDRPVGRPILHG